MLEIRKSIPTSYVGGSGSLVFMSRYWPFWCLVRSEFHFRRDHGRTKSRSSVSAADGSFGWQVGVHRFYLTLTTTVMDTPSSRSIARCEVLDLVVRFASFGSVSYRRGALSHLTCASQQQSSTNFWSSLGVGCLSVEQGTSCPVKQWPRADLARVM